MLIYRHYLEKASWLLESYQADMPFHLFLKQFFSREKKYGSRDRKAIASLCYSFFRTGYLLKHLKTADAIAYANFLVSHSPSTILASLLPELNEQASLSLVEKLALAANGLSLEGVFPFYSLLSEGLQGNNYCISMLHQPDVFLRARPGAAKDVEKKLVKLEWHYKKEAGNCFRIQSGYPVEGNFTVNRDLVIQDLNSQNTGAVISEVFARYHFYPAELWDCCAASGGKSIMLNDLFPNLEITVSDIRPTILSNLNVRFREAGIRVKHQFVADLSLPNANPPIKPMEFVLADVPCSGSGTWARTPEQLFYFKPAIIEEYAAKQKSIVKNAIRYIKPGGGWFVYITCSVFKQENEAIVALVLAEKKFELVHAVLLDGTRQKADSMFIAIFRSL